MVERGYATVDPEKCFSYGVCVEVMPEVFHLDEDGKSVVRSGAVGPLSAFIEAAEDCPMQAISVTPLEVSGE